MNTIEKTYGPHIKTFNTGRQYTPEGQRIAYVIVKRVEVDGNFVANYVFFVDADRDVDGVVIIHGHEADEITKQQVLKAYDDGGYGSIYEQFEDPSDAMRLKKALYAAGQALDASHREKLRALKVGEELEVHTEDDWCAFCDVPEMYDRGFRFDRANYVITRTL